MDDEARRRHPAGELVGKARAPLLERGGTVAERERAHRRRPTLVPHAPARVVDLGFGDAVDHAGEEVHDPALREEADDVRVQHCLDESRAHVAGRHAPDVGGRPSRVREREDPRAGRAFPEQPRDVEQLEVVQHEHRFRARGGDQRVREVLAECEEALPLVARALVERRRAPAVPQRVMRQPQRLIREVVLDRVENRRIVSKQVETQRLLAAEVDVDAVGVHRRDLGVRLRQRAREPGDVEVPSLISDHACGSAGREGDDELARRRPLVFDRRALRRHDDLPRRAHRVAATCGAGSAASAGPAARRSSIPASTPRTRGSERPSGLQLVRHDLGGRQA